MRRLTLLGLLLCAFSLQADALPNYPATYSDVVAHAGREKELVIYGVVHADAAVGDLLSHFRTLYPFITIHNSDGDSAKTYRRFISEVFRGEPSADFVWSSAMDLQEKLINDGFSAPYTTPEISVTPKGKTPRETRSPALIRRICSRRASI